MNDVTKDLLKALKIVTSQLERVGDTRKHKDGEFIDLGREAIARAEAALAEPQPDADGPWKSAVIDQLVIAHILTAEHESDPLKAIQDLLAYHADIVVDPRVSGAAAKLVEQAKAEEREACAKVCDELFPPPSEQMTVEWAAGTVACANAIRARGQK